ncbi:MAG: PTS galactitol transporter subunit IIC [Erysipelotrichaceae bacterium]|nr:PTS galactitol transporter subunit IIC [Erysipelotrichaceae bacterium]
MEAFLNTLSNIFGAFGSGIIIPIILFVLSKAMGVDTKKAFNSALLCGVGLTGFNLVINSYSGVIAPVVQSMVDNTGIKLSTIDTGWQSTSIIAYSTTVGVLFIGVAIALQLILFFVGFTDVFMASDLWNNYSFMVWGSMLYALTGNMLLAMALMVCQLFYILLFSEMCALRWGTYYEYDGCCMTAPHHLESFPFTVLMDWILTKLGFNKIKINASDLQKKLGLLGEPMMIGLFVGLLIGLIGEAPFLFGENALTAWGTALGVAINTAAIMAVFPKVAAIFASAFTSMSDAYKSRAAASAKERRWFLSVNDACGYGETNTLVTGVLLIPIMLVLAFIMQPLGNNVLPMADLCALPYMVEVFVCVSNGNIAKSVVMGAIWFGLGLILFSQLAPTFTQVAVGTGQFTVPEGALNVCSFGIVCHPFMIALFYAFWKGGVVAIAVLVVLYVVLYVWFRKNKQKVYDYLENNAAAYKA